MLVIVLQSSPITLPPFKLPSTSLLSLCIVKAKAFDPLRQWLTRNFITISYNKLRCYCTARNIDTLFPFVGASITFMTRDRTRPILQSHLGGSLFWDYSWYRYWTIKVHEEKRKTVLGISVGKFHKEQKGNTAWDLAVQRGYMDAGHRPLGRGTGWVLQFLEVAMELVLRGWKELVAGAFAGAMLLEQLNGMPNK